MWFTMSNSIDTVNIVVPVVLRDRLASHRLHGRQALHEIIEDALAGWEDGGGWFPHLPLRFDRP